MGDLLAPNKIAKKTIVFEIRVPSHFIFPSLHFPGTSPKGRAWDEVTLVWSDGDEVIGMR